MIAPLASGQCQPNGRRIALGIIAILMSIAPHEASARGGPLHLLDAWAVSRAQAATGSASRNEPTTETLGVGCSGKRYRDPTTHRCRGPADFGN